MEFIRKSHLPRLDRAWYRGRAFVLWTLPMEARAIGWLNPLFHQRWQLILQHACSRYNLVCPAFVLMPDHVHHFWLGLDEHGSDQCVAVEFLRKHLRSDLWPADWQHQSHDRVLREIERERNTFLNVASYILDNPVRAGLVRLRQDYAYLGCCVPGYPDLDIHRADYWELFWRIYNKRVEQW